MDSYSRIILGPSGMAQKWCRRIQRTRYTPPAFSFPSLPMKTLPLLSSLCFLSLLISCAPLPQNAPTPSNETVPVIEDSSSSQSADEEESSASVESTSSSDSSSSSSSSSSSEDGSQESSTSSSSDASSPSDSSTSASESSSSSVESTSASSSSSSSVESSTSARVVEVTVTGWSFTPSTITATKGEALEVRLVGGTGDHSFNVPDLGIDVAISGGQTKTVTIPTDRAGTFPFKCEVFCGSGHSDMHGTIVISE